MKIFNLKEIANNNNSSFQNLTPLGCYLLKPKNNLDYRNYGSYQQEDIILFKLTNGIQDFYFYLLESYYNLKENELYIRWDIGGYCPQLSFIENNFFDKSYRNNWSYTEKKIIGLKIISEYDVSDFKIIDCEIPYERATYRNFKLEYLIKWDSFELEKVYNSYSSPFAIKGVDEEKSYAFGEVKLNNITYPFTIPLNLDWIRWTQKNEMYYSLLGETYVSNSNLFPDEGLKKLEKQQSKFISELKENPKYFAIYCDLKGTDGNVSNNRKLKTFLEYIKFDLEKLKEIFDKYLDDKKEFNLDKFPGVDELLCSQNKQKNWHLLQDVQKKVGSIGCDPEKYPKTFQAIMDGNIPPNLFHHSNTGAQVNIEWKIWEELLTTEYYTEQDLKEIFNICANASGRTTYEKNLMPYFYFIMYKLGPYLERCAPRTHFWKIYPKFVDSTWQAEMEEENENDTVKRRSVMTPIVDNEAGTVHVPYCAIVTHGRNTSYCYSLQYHVLEEGFVDPISDSPCLEDFKEKLNGRDDYSLMYYTLTGTPSTRGYPSFLIIFERLMERTRVHFHRIHPCKLKFGHYTPASLLVEEAYRYMAGNIRAEEIYAQQGDMIFIEENSRVFKENSKSSGEDKESWKLVSEFESHSFSLPVKLYEKKNSDNKQALGYIVVDEDLILQHPEHEDIELDKGIYFVQRCRSWEANPIAVWSYTFD